MTSVIYVNSSTDSEEEGQPDAKRARREKPKLTTAKVLSSKQMAIPKASTIPQAAAIKAAAAMGGSAGSRTLVGSYKSMHIPSGITVTKHNNSNGSINIVNAKPSLENNNNNNTSNNNNSLKAKTVKLSLSAAAQNSTVWSKTPATLATITSVPCPAPAKMTPLSKAFQKPATQLQHKVPQQQQQQQKAPVQQKTATPFPILQKPLTMVQQKSGPQQQQKLPIIQQSQQQQKQMPKLLLQPPQQKPMTMQQLQQQQKLEAAMLQPKSGLLQQQKPPTLTPQKVIQLQPQPKSQTPVQLSIAQKLSAKQKQQIQQRLTALPKQSLNITSAQPKAVPVQLHVAPQNQPPPAHSGTPLSLQQKQKSALAPPPPAHNPLSSTTTLTPPVLAKLTPMPVLSKQPMVIKPNANIITSSSAARTTPYKTRPSTTTTTTTMKNVQQVTSATPIQAGATPPLRLLATPPHCAAALNEPLLLNLPATTSITPQLTPTTTPPPPAVTASVKMTFPYASISPVQKTPAKRVQPITVLKKSDEEWRKHIAQQQQQQQQEKPKPEQEIVTPTIVLVESPPTTPPTDKVDNEPAKRKTPPAVVTAAPKEPTPKEPAVRAPLVSEYTALLQLCRELDKSKDMERLIDIKLMKYYYSVHENFVRSRGFRKQLQQTMERIRSEPDMIYVHLKCVVDELKVRRKAKAVLPLQEEEKPQPTADEKSQAPTPGPEVKEKASEDVPPVTPSTGNKRTDERIRKLNRTLYTITKRISALEEADVDWNDDDDSSYLQVERYKKRACQIYEKICDLTGESKSAHRQMKQPILFKDSPYPQFNRTLSAFVNRMHEFPDYHDVLQLLEHCNKDKALGLASFEMKRIAHDAFVKVGRLLQTRRKTDLYETVTHFTANAKDPAASDATLLAKLNENNKKQTKISDILEKFAREQDLSTEEQREARLKEKQLQAEKAAAATNDAVANAADDDDEKPCTSAQAAQAAQAQVQTEADQSVLTNGITKHENSENESDSDDEEEDEESDEDVDTFVDNFKANGDVSDAESETELNAAPKTLAAAAHVIVNSVKRVKTAAPIDNDKDNIGIDDDKIDQMQTLQNGKLKDAPAAAHMLKIMSVSSLNASVSPNSNIPSNNSQEQPQQQKQQQEKQKQKQKKQEKILIDTEIVISDEES